MGKGRKKKRETSDTTLFINEKQENLNLRQIENLEEMIAQPIMQPWKKIELYLILIIPVS